ncbi:MAG: hypothetical protein WCZ66_11475 [Sphingomonadaceae bacterium]
MARSSDVRFKPESPSTAITLACSPPGRLYGHNREIYPRAKLRHWVFRERRPVRPTKLLLSI